MNGASQHLLHKALNAGKQKTLLISKVLGIFLSFLLIKFKAVVFYVGCFL